MKFYFSLFRVVIESLDLKTRDKFSNFCLNLPFSKINDLKLRIFYRLKIQGLRINTLTFICNYKMQIFCHCINDKNLYYLQWLIKVNFLVISIFWGGENFSQSKNREFRLILREFSPQVKIIASLLLKE